MVLGFGLWPLKFSMSRSFSRTSNKYSSLVQKPKTKNEKSHPNLKIILVIVGIVLAAIGGVIAYRAIFLEPSAAVVITNTEVREVPDMMRIIGGTALFVAGATLASSRPEANAN